MKKKKIKKIVVFGLNNVGKKILRYLKKKKVQIFLIYNKPSFHKIKKINPDLILSLGYRHILPSKILKLSKFGAYNIHKSLLPMNKGANPVFWTILNNQQAGVSVHQMNSKIDKGPVVMQKKINFDLSYNAKMLYEKLELIQFSMFKKFWKNILNGKLSNVKNNHTSTFHKKKEFLNMINLKFIDKNKFLYFLNFLRASTFPPFRNIVIREKNQNYHVEIKIKKIKRKLNIKYGALKSYK